MIFSEKVLNTFKSFLFSVLLISSTANAENIRLQIKGLSGALEKNVRAQLSTIQSSEITPNLRFRSRVDHVIREGLKAFGYYEPKISFGFLYLPEQKCNVLVAHVIPGDPILISSIKIILQGEAKTDKDYLDLLNTSPQIGSVLNHKDYDNFKKSLTEIALRKGYFHAHFNKSNLGISLNQHQAYWDINYDSGERYRFGTVTFEGSQIQKEYLQNIIPFREGDYYQLNTLSELNRRFLKSGWFSSIIIDPEFEKAYKNKVLPIRVVLSPSKKNVIEIGTGYSTNTGLRMKGIWEKPWINSYGHNLITTASTSAIEQKLYFNYAIPLLKNPTEQYYLIKGGIKHSDLNKTNLKSVMLSFSRYWKLTSSWERALNLRLSLSRFIQSNIINTSMLIYPGLTISRTRSCGSLMPTWGDSERYSINYSSNMWGSDVNFIVIQAQNSWIRTFFDRHRFVVKTHFGWINTKNFEKVPPDLRFFFKGDRSIRGYKYKVTALKDDNVNLIGASKMTIGSLEYLYNIIGKWWLAIFFDGGELVKNIHHNNHNNFKVGIGVGARWKSLFGPVKLDFAVPLSSKVKRGLQFYIGLGPEL